MPDTFQQTTSRGYGSRLGNSIAGAFIGVVLFLGSFGVLWWNEGNFVRVAKGLNEGRSVVVELDGGKISSENDGKLVHVTDKTSTGEELLVDSVFGIKSDALMLERKVEMYQWKEEEETKSHESVGGTETTTTTYTYSKEWSTELNPSEEFGKPDGHENPSTMPYESEKQFADDAKLGDFNLRDSTIKKIDDAKSVPVTGFDVKTVPNSHVNGSYIYIGEKPSAPAIGDVRVSFSAILPGTVSVVAKQDGNNLVPYKTSSGSTIELVASGEQSSEEIFDQAEDANNLMTWLLRLGGFLAMWMGLMLVFNPLSMIFAFLPFLKDIVGFVVGVAMFGVALVLSGATIALAWLFYRPLVSVIILVVAVGIAWLIKLMIIDKKKTNSGQPPQNPQPPTTPPKMTPPQSQQPPVASPAAPAENGTQSNGPLPPSTPPLG